MNKVPIEMRQLAKDLEAVAKVSPCYSNIWYVIQNTIDHILAIARTIELRDQLDKTNEDRPQT